MLDSSIIERLPHCIAVIKLTNLHKFKDSKPLAFHGQPFTETLVLTAYIPWKTLTDRWPEANNAWAMHVISKIEPRLKRSIKAGLVKLEILDLLKTHKELEEWQRLNQTTL